VHQSNLTIKSVKKLPNKNLYAKHLITCFRANILGSVAIKQNTVFGKD